MLVTISAFVLIFCYYLPLISTEIVKEKMSFHQYKFFDQKMDLVSSLTTGLNTILLKIFL